MKSTKVSVNNISFDDEKINILLTTNRGYLKYNILNFKTEENLLSGSLGHIQYSNNKSNEITVFNGGTINSYCAPNVFVISDMKKKVYVDAEQKILNLFIINEEDRINIVIVLLNELKIYNQQGTLLMSYDTYDNPLGLCDVRKDKFDNIIILCIGLKQGEVCIWNFTKNISATIIINRSKPISLIKLNNDSSLFAVVVVSTEIHIHKIHNGTHVKTFRRGTDIFTKSIYDICFSYDKKYMVCCSSSSTVHIFNLDNSNNKKSALNFAKNYLPQYFSSEWAFKTIKIPEDSRMICTFDKKGQIHICLFNKKYYKISGDKYINIEKKEI